MRNIVLDVFSKFYNKWFVHWEKSRAIFEKGSKKHKVMMRMVQNSGDRDLREVDLNRMASGCQSLCIVSNT